MRQRLAIAISGLVAAGVLAIGLSAAGFGPVDRADPSDDQGTVAFDAAVEPVEPEVIYVEPAAQPETVIVNKRAKASDGRTQARRNTEVRAAEREDEDEEAEHRRERQREARKERREHRRETAKERGEHERDDEQEGEDD
jgi:hypothetical protein